ncbi:hypothetical protein ACOT81_41935 [Streptomyces sp. WI04-05B]|uniref:hypothetical protein n=1 Tax=Streptomyces TaxID=1883 RepID=UPI0029B713EC|nr:MULTISPECIES: hypothetical protein [unclassified Streptomyces]MDX2543514.1 hypothetical protein [Streptomyces sp. WI04-05B]MDX2582998.1 hypothetical protein [Streptomyces sp. WI04-05A]MDX3748667.1 hypothetical protein [Streptomyces sp. AK08-02]
MTTARRMAGSIAVAAALIAGSTALATGPAAAKGEVAAAPGQARVADWDGNVYLYYSASSNSSWSKYGTAVNDFAGHTFAAGGEGHGLRVKNNVNRAWNNDPSFRARIFYNENQNASGNAPYDDVWPGESRPLNSGVQNNNASLGWYYAG